MILGKVIGRSSTIQFKFLVEGNAKKFQYLQVLHEDNYVLAQIVEIERDIDRTVASCNILGYKDEQNILRPLRTAFEPGIEILNAEDDFIKKILDLEESKNSAYLGVLEGRDKLKVYLDLNKLLTKHVCILAKSGAGKSYTAGVLIEEIVDRNIPILIIDPHGEYTSLKYPNAEDKENLVRFGIEAKNYIDQVQEYGLNAKHLKLSNQNLSPSELIHMLPSKLSSTQMGVLYSALNSLGKEINFDEIIQQLEMEEGNAKWTLINIIEYIKKLDIFSDYSTEMNELVKQNKVSIINLKGIPPEVQEVIVYKLTYDLFEARKKEEIPPFFLIVEEAHNFLPERSFGEAKSSKILRQVASEGRKFGLGMCIISQRPSRLDKSVISQASTQLISRITNPNDLKSLSSSLEGLTSETEREIKNIPVGTVMVVGLTDLPVFVDVRPRKTKHGGGAVNILDVEKVEEKEFIESKEDFEEKNNLLPLIKPKIDLNDLKVMHGSSKIKTELIPCSLLVIKDFRLLFDLTNGQIINNIEDASGEKLTAVAIDNLTSQQKNILKVAINLNEFKAADLLSESGAQFSEVYDITNILTGKGLFIKINDEYKLNDKIGWLSKLKELSFLGKIEFSDLSYDKILEKNYDIQKIKEYLSNFIDIDDEKECYLVKYSP